MARILTNFGEEYAVQNGLDSGTATWDVGLYDDASAGTTGDAIADADNVAAITTEPAGTSYARQADTFSLADVDGDVAGLLDGSTNDTKLSFNTSDSTANVDSWFLVINFQASSQTALTDNLVATGALSQAYDLSNVDQLDISAGGVGIQLD